MAILKRLTSGLDFLTSGKLTFGLREDIVVALLVVAVSIAGAKLSS